ncbi:hypothetical protein QBC37DRAFT_381368 [Rhypophila decipiens]|uniref:Uncharacterized protein n=1 Tax=Rhypophila decipiens TaxID=261697 RepID=A0AAN7B0A0_9PEZI|nr:hypothetical protein QBC37DRAFT_381368 [Rhypophila decipiens]
MEGAADGPHPFSPAETNARSRPPASPAAVDDPVPVHAVSLLRGSRTASVEEVPLATRTTPAPAPSREPSARRAARGPSGKSPQAQGSTPRAPKAGLCGRLAAGQTYHEPPGGTAQLGKPSAADPPGRASSWGV